MRNSDFRLPASLLLCLSLIAGLPGAAGAADKDPAREQARRLQEQKRVLESEKKRLQQENSELSGKLVEAQAEADKKKALAASLDDSRRRLRGASERSEQLMAEVASLKSNVAAREAEVEKLKSALAAEQAARGKLEKESAACSTRNEALYRQGRTLIEAFGRYGECDAVLIAEPLFGLGRVERENRLEAERDAFDEQRNPARASN